MKRVILLLFCLSLPIEVAAQSSTVGIPPSALAPPVVVFPASAINGAGIASGPIGLVDGNCGGSATAALYWNSQNTMGFARQSSSIVDLCLGSLRFNTATAQLIWITRSVLASPADGQLTFSNNAGTAGIGTTFSTDGKWIINTRSGGTAATQIATTQTTVPTCSASCGTSPSVVGSDTAMIVTMGATGVPASPFTVTFNGTWAAAPSCVATLNTGTTAIVNKAATTQTTVVITTAAAPATSDKFAIHCIGIQ